MLRWLKELFGLPATWGGVLTTGATMANFGPACARRWWGLQHGVDIDERGTAGLPAMPVFGSGYVHASDVKALAMLGVGRSNVRRLARDRIGRIDLEALDRELAALGGAPAVLIASAGEVNAGDFDPLDAMATSPSGTAPGCTSTARSGCSLRCPIAPVTSSPDSSAPIRRSPTATSGSTSPTSRASRSVRDPSLQSPCSAAAPPPAGRR